MGRKQISRKSRAVGIHLGSAILGADNPGGKGFPGCLQISYFGGVQVIRNHQVYTDLNSAV